MTKRTRTILFVILILLFVLTAPSVVFYSQGYRFDFETKKIVQTGAFYFKVLPRSTEIYLDGELEKKASALTGSVLIENLLPKTYAIEIKKGNYYSWQKNLEIKEKQVTEAKNIVLVPQNPNLKILSKNVKNFFPSPDRKKIILKKGDEKTWYLTLFDPEKNVQSVLSNEDFSKNRTFLNLDWAPDSKRLLLETALGEKQEYFILEIEKPLSSTSLGYLGTLDKIYFNPQNYQKLFVLKNNGLYQSDLPGKKTELLPILTDVRNIIFSDNLIYYLDTSGFLFKTDLSFRLREKINETPFSLKKGVKYELNVFGGHVFLQEEISLYSLNATSKSFEKIFESVKNIKVSPNFKKIVFYNNYEIWILFLEDEYDQPQKKAGEKVFLTRFSEKIEEIFWWTSHYLIFNVGDKIKIAEIDDRDKINIVNLAEFPPTTSGGGPEIFWNQIDKKLYILSNENLYQSENLLP